MAKFPFRKAKVSKFLPGAALAALLVSGVCVGAGVTASAHPIAAPHWMQQNNTQATEVSGKVVGIGQDKKSISLQVSDGNNTNTMQFAIDDNTRVTGRISVGNMATIQYQNGDGGKLVALNISPKSQ